MIEISRKYGRRKKMSGDLMIIGTIFLLGSIQSALAGDYSHDMPRDMTQAGGLQHEMNAAAGQRSDHAHDKMDMYDSGQVDMKQGNMKKGFFMEKKTVDGYQVSFHIIKAEGAAYGGIYHFMIKVEQHGKVISNLLANSKVKHPNNQSESKMMMKMGDWYMAAYDLAHPGTHELMVLFKTNDGLKHFAGVHYSVERKK
jgi:hypothetical protein